MHDSPPPPSAPLPETAPRVAAGEHATADGAPRRARWWRLAALFAIALAACFLAYLAVAVPGRWFSAADAVSWGPADLQVTRGHGRIVGDELHVLPADTSGIIVVSLRTKLPSLDYASVAWIAIDVPDDVQASLLWRSDYRPDAMNSVPLTALTGRLLPVTVLGHRAWLGRIEGLALAIRGPVAEPIRIRGVTVKPHDAREIALERWREWTAFEGWTGASINTITGGADLQDLPLPMLLACATLIAALAAAALHRWRPAAWSWGLLGALAACAAAAWIVLDVRWTWNLVRQVRSDAATFASKGFDERRAAVEDGELYAFLQKAKALMPSEPVRVFVAADSHYFRGRAAYHLLPHRVMFDPRANTIAGPEVMRPGDWLLVYHRRGVEYDPAQGRLRWSNLPPVAVELKAATRGGGLFLLK